MSWRTIVITNRCKLDLKLGYLVIRTDEVKRVFLDEVQIIIIENTAVSLTTALIAELSKRNIKVIFCDTKRNPICELTNYYGSYDCSQKIKYQIDWNNDLKKIVWTEIIRDKIVKQSEFLNEIGNIRESDMLISYANELEYNDPTNREGHAAKVYFNSLFGKDFNRNDDSNIINSALDYGYSIILSIFNREVVANGFLTQLGFHHCNMFNQFNLSCDLMEPFRIIIDRFVYYNRFDIFDTDEKHQLLSILNEYVFIDNSKQIINNAIRIYVKGIFDSLNDNDLSKLKFYKYEL